MEECKHYWISNSGNGGIPRFKPGMFGQHLVMHVRCCKCGDRTWLTNTQWNEFLTPNYHHQNPIIPPIPTK